MYSVVKRLIDMLVSLLLIILLSPVYLTLYFLVKAKIGSPVLFTQVRPGFKEKLFNIKKFRTMTMDVDEQGVMLPDEQRLTKFGQWLRSSSMDELPSLFNVLLGDLSLVGPRPLLPQYLDLYTADQLRRHDVMPGITGWVQVNGRNNLTWDEKFELDIWYVDNRSFLLDVKILLLTIKKVIIKEGISAKEHVSMDVFTGSSKEDEQN